MTGKTHAAVGVWTTAALIILHPSGFGLGGVKILPVVSLATAALGSYLPDIDIQQSALGRKHKFISKMLKHRGFTHTLVIPAFLFLIMCFSAAYLSTIPTAATVLNSLLFGLLLGWVLHIFADLFNRKGVPLCYPVSKSHIHVAAVKTRHWTEGLWLFLYVICLGAVVMKIGGFV